MPNLAAQPSRALIAAAVPRGMRRAGSQQEWLRILKEAPEVLVLRCDGYANLLRIANLITWAADWSTMCSRPTIARLVEVTGLSESSVKRWVRWLRVRGWLGVVEQGSTVRYRKGTHAGLVDDGLGNRAAVWVLAVPRRFRADRLRHRNDHECKHAEQPERTSEPPSVSLPERHRADPTRAREKSPHRFRDHHRIPPTWSLHATARTKRDKIALCERLRTELPLLRRVTAWYLRWWLAPFIDEGWTAADVLHALDVRADDSRWTYTWSSSAEIRHVPGWVRYRLSAWLDEQGRPVASRSQRRARADEVRRSAQETRRREWARMAAAAGWLLGPDRSADDASPVDRSVAPGGPAADPSAEYRAVRAEMERRRRERAAAQEAMWATWQARRPVRKVS
ncbi:hypothetical protein FXF51_01465 [Nonomuraea sp. PA05]|uniref:hypothetical protein n=1 Tax=Nonomuraea sp. PA05 TaxID=2604466 RepID=UPI0011D2F7F1|nr:hypothetical protein [Nonomuraea sp. PA05]TYB71129.1 hypothetical protein FXF51_01465 [Nonomuraea sp. PA05]